MYFSLEKNKTITVLNYITTDDLDPRGEGGGIAVVVISGVHCTQLRNHGCENHLQHRRQKTCLLLLLLLLLQQSIKTESLQSRCFALLSLLCAKQHQLSLSVRKKKPSPTTDILSPSLQTPRMMMFLVWLGLSPLLSAPLCMSSPPPPFLKGRGGERGACLCEGSASDGSGRREGEMKWQREEGKVFSGFFAPRPEGGEGREREREREATNAGAAAASSSHTRREKSGERRKEKNREKLKILLLLPPPLARRHDILAGGKRKEGGVLKRTLRKNPDLFFFTCICASWRRRQQQQLSCEEGRLA